jgi:hypothetical protein
MIPDTVITILRTPHELRALVNHSNFTFVNKPDGNTAEEFASWYTLREFPLTSLEVSITSKYKQLLTSWDALKSIQAWDQHCLFHLLVVLLETAPLFSPPEQEHSLPPLPFSPKPHQATAKHPRAYQGTTYQPPKAKSLTRLNLQPYICEPNHLRTIVHKLHPYWHQALTQCTQVGYKVQELSSLSLEQFENLKHVDIYYAVHHGLYDSIKPYKIPTNFITTLLPLLQGIRWQGVLDLLVVYWGASVQHNPLLLPALSKLLSLSNEKTTRQWCHLLMGVPPHRRVLFLTLLIESKTYRVDAYQYSLDDLEKFHAITPDEQYQSRLFFFFSALKKNIPTGYMLAGFQLANTYVPSYTFQTFFSGCDSFPYQIVTAIIEHVKETKEYYKNFSLRIWEKCGEFPDFARLLRQCNWTSFLPETTYRLLNIYLFFASRWELSPDTIQKKWRYLQQHHHVLIARLNEIPPEYQVKFLHLMHDFYWYWDSLEYLQRYIPHAMNLSQRLSCSPFSSRKNKASEALSYFIDCTSSQTREAFLQAPHSSFAKLEKACRSENRGQLITYGIAALLKELPQFAVTSFISYPGKLCTLAKQLGTLSRPRRHAVLQHFKSHPLLHFQAEEFSLRQICDLIKSYCQEGITNPLPKKLQAHVYEQYELTEGRVSRYRGKMKEQLTATLLDLLHQQIILKRDQQYPLPPTALPQWKHTMQLMSWIDDNRRGFKRFLREYLAGNTSYLQTHPETQAWRAKHPRICFDLWQKGISLSKTVNKHGPLCLDIEHNPLEALKLGTYVNTCLGIGGLCTYSAAAIILDENKQVIYAKNQQGTVVARQVIALSEEEQLVCFSVYPLSADQELLAFFREYDRSFAQALGIELYKEKKDEDYTIQHILSQAWWDDTPWDFKLQR